MKLLMIYFYELLKKISHEKLKLDKKMEEYHNEQFIKLLKIDIKEYEERFKKINNETEE